MDFRTSSLGVPQAAPSARRTYHHAVPSRGLGRSSQFEAEPAAAARRFDLQGLEALLDGEAEVELPVDGGDAVREVGVLFEPGISRRGLPDLLR